MSYLQDLCVDTSDIQGEGLFSMVHIPKGSKVFKAIDIIVSPPYFKILPAASKMNHSVNPNTAIQCTGKEYWQIALYDLVPGEEITSDYRLAPSFVNRNIEGFV